MAVKTHIRAVDGDVDCRWPEMMLASDASRLGSRFQKVLASRTAQGWARVVAEAQGEMTLVGVAVTGRRAWNKASARRKGAIQTLIRIDYIFCRLGHFFFHSSSPSCAHFRED